MQKQHVASVGSWQVILMNSITSIGPEDQDQIVISASHGGSVSGEYATRYPLAAVFFNDAGVGKESAGIVALGMLDREGVPAGAVANGSARIGDARDHWDNGVLSHVNESARALGFQEGGRLQAAIKAAFSNL
jgi:hypothetical protein